ncbi:cell division protein ZapA [[Clostridium] polysaccharolyticum]|uniref:Cell division protein ZapA n=1 Tax=[Clostridium] polysaccharolyticum TaxID=29364 RepID=A0A1I0B4F1_9FIRM|nr:cell division protein ZapA [[Clostridium] polysaccharolyticum]SET01249.1 cell division protein ZapA [[Clostridium] polysaccharolyticum]
MGTKNDAHVVINNKEFVICGYESSEYLQKVAAYLNNKIAECKEIDGYQNLERDMKNFMLEINIVDDYFKAQAKAAELEAENSRKENELYQLKHEFIALKEKLGKTKEELEQVGPAYEAAKRQIKRLEEEKRYQTKK